jgi:hypothetical protein
MKEKRVGLHYSRFQKTLVETIPLTSQKAAKIAQKQRELRKSG